MELVQPHVLVNGLGGGMVTVWKNTSSLGICQGFVKNRKAFFESYQSFGCSTPLSLSLGCSSFSFWRVRIGSCCFYPQIHLPIQTLPQRGPHEKALKSCALKALRVPFPTHDPRKKSSSDSQDPGIGPLLRQQNTHHSHVPGLWMISVKKAQKKHRRTEAPQLWLAKGKMTKPTESSCY